MVDYFSRTDLNFSFPAAGQGAVVRDLFLSDVNGDGSPDAVLTYEYYPIQNQPLPVRVLLGDGRGGFSDAADGVFAGGAPTFVDAKAHAVADFNGDGKPDIFFANTGYEQQPYAGGANGLLLSGPGGLTDASVELPGYVAYNSGASAGDVDGDSKADVAVAALGRSPYLLIGDGTGHFHTDTTSLPAAIADPANGQYGTALLFDADNDGRPDLFLGGDGDSKILLNDGSGHFVVPHGMTYPVEGAHNVVAAVAADVNGDGLKDVVEAVALNNFSQGEIRILVNEGDGIFADQTAARLVGSPVLTDGSAWIRSIQAADFDGDGVQDLLLSGGAHTVVLLNDGGGFFAPMPGTADLGVLDRAAAADLNGDGRADLLVRSGDPNTVEHVSVYLSQPVAAEQTGDDAANALMGSAGDDHVDAMAGNDTVMASGGADAVRAFDGDDQVYGGLADDTVNGNKGEDTVHGGPGADCVCGGQGDDLVYGDVGDDYVNGNRGADQVFGGAGADTLHGGQANDWISGGAGADWLNGDLGDDSMTGGAGADTFHASHGVDRITDFNAADGDVVQLDPGTTYTVSASGSDTVLDLGGGDELILVGVSPSSLAGDWITFG
jgi:Ca2+-binding RTX toxin-like protein